MANVVLVAASGLALEAAEAARRAGDNVLGCVDDDSALWHTSVRGWLPVLGGLSLLKDLDAQHVVCVGKGAVRRRVIERLAALGRHDDQAGTIIDPSATVPTSAQIGAGSVLLAGAVLTAQVVIGRHVVCMPHVTLTHDDVVEDFATLCAGVTLGGGVRVKTAAYVGMAASARERVTIGAASVLGMGSVLLADLPDEETWAGIPARRLGK